MEQEDFNDSSVLNNSMMRERMAVVETKLDDLKKDISEIKVFLQTAEVRYESKFAYKEELKSINKDIADLQSRFFWIIGVLITILFALKLTGVI